MSGVLCMLMSAGDAPSIIFTPMTATGSSSSSPVSTNIIVASVSSGSGHTFAWSYESGAVDLVPSFALNSATQRWSAALSPGEDRSAVWKCVASLGGNPVAEATITPFVQRF